MNNDLAEIQHLRRVCGLPTVEHYASLGSTNDRGRELALDEHSALPALILADVQTAGRGRGANRWWTGPGSLAMSLVIDPAHWKIALEHSPLVSLALALSVINTVQPLLPPADVAGLHWPNDVFVGGRKLCGILVEVPRPRRFVLGIGINLNNTTADAPADVAARATTLRDLAGREHSRSEVVARLVDAIGRQLSRLGRNPAQIGAQAHAACLQIDNWLTVDTGFRRLSGRCLGIADDGALRLATSSQVELVYAGCLVHDAPSTLPPAD